MKSKITFIGSGNVATNLAVAFDRAGHTINQVVSKHEEHAKALAQRFGAYFGTELSTLYNDSDFVIICVNDESYADVVSKLPYGLGGIVCHTSGPVALDVIKEHVGRCGVIYPLQSLTKNNVHDLLDVPFFVEGSDRGIQEKIASLVDSISNSVTAVTSEDRMKYHVAAVFANNFTNLMYVIASEYLKKEGLEFKHLLPIIKESVNRLNYLDPADVQTGPAKRGDMKIIEKHLSMLQDSEVRAIYERLSKFIMTQL